MHLAPRNNFIDSIIATISPWQQDNNKVARARGLLILIHKIYEILNFYLLFFTFQVIKGSSMEHAGCIVTASIAGFFYKGYASVEYNTKRQLLSSKSPFL